jgi:hypothetical protein
MHETTGRHHLPKTCTNTLACHNVAANAFQMHLWGPQTLLVPVALQHLLLLYPAINVVILVFDWRSWPPSSVSYTRCADVSRTGPTPALSPQVQPGQ